MNKIPSVLSLVALSVWLGACAPASTFREVHAFAPVPDAFGVAAPALPPAVAALGMQVAQTTSTPREITVTAVTPEGVRVQITLRPSSETTSTLDVGGDSEQQALAQLATRLAESMARQLAQQAAEPSRAEELAQIGYVMSSDEPPEPER